MSSAGYAWAWKLALPAFPLLVLLALVEHASDQDGSGIESAWPGIARLSERTGMSESSVKRAISELEATGLISIDHRYRPNGGRMTNRYILNVGGQGDLIGQSDPTGQSDLGGQSDPGHTGQPDPRGGSHRPHPQVTVTSITKEEPPNESPTESGAAKRGTRIPEDFVVDAAMRAWAAEHTPRVDVDRSTAKFIDHWASVPGQRGVKLDWLRTWRNWLRETEERLPPAPVEKSVRERWGL